MLESLLFSRFKKRIVDQLGPIAIANVTNLVAVTSDASAAVVSVNRLLATRGDIYSAGLVSVNRLVAAEAQDTHVLATTAYMLVATLDANYQDVERD